MPDFEAQLPVIQDNLASSESDDRSSILEAPPAQSQVAALDSPSKAMPAVRIGNDLFMEGSFNTLVHSFSLEANCLLLKVLEEHQRIVIGVEERGELDHSLDGLRGTVEADFLAFEQFA